MTPTPSLSALNNTSTLFRSLCICDLNIPGFPVQYRSRHFTLSPRGLRVGDCEFLNLQGKDDGGPKEGTYLTLRTGVDGRPMFVLECVGGLYAIDGDVGEGDGGRAGVEAELGPAAYVFASQIDVTMRIRALAAAVLRSRQDAVTERIAAEEAEQEREKSRRLDVQQQMEQEQKRQAQHVHWVKESLLVHSRRQFHALPTTTDEYSRYFSDSDESDGDDDGREGASTSDESEAEIRSPSRSSPSTSATSSNNSDNSNSRNRTSLTSLPNTTFLHYGPKPSSVRSAASKQANQLRTTTTHAKSHANADANADIWLAESFASARLPDPGYPTLPRTPPYHSPAPLASPTSSSPSPTTILASQHLAPLLTTLRLLHRSCFVLKRQFDRTRTTPSKKYSQWQLSYMSAALLAERASKELVAKMVGVLGGVLEAERDVRVFVPWAEEVVGKEKSRRKGEGEGKGKGKGKGRGKEGKWIYAVPMIRGRADDGAREGVEVEKSWMCFVVGGEVGDLWNSMADV